MTENQLMRALTLSVLLASCCLLTACDSGTTEAEEKGFAIDQEFASDPADPADPADTPANTNPATQPGNNNPGSEQPGTTPPPADTPADTGLSCQEIYAEVGGCYQAYSDCASPCQDQACADACEETYWGCFDGKVAEGSTQGQSEFNSVRACEDQNYQACYDKGGVVYNECAEQCSDDNCTKGCADQANGILKGCMEESCNAEFVQCGLLDDAPDQNPGDNTPQDPGTPAEDGLTCKGIYDAVGECYGAFYDCASPCQDQACADACEETYWGCFDGKVAEGGNQAQTDFKALRDCEDANYQECYDEGGVVYNDCAGQCADDDCTKGCADEANAVLKECMVSYCQSEFDTCGVFDEETPNDNGNNPGNEGGELSCGDLYNCEDACNGDQNCGQSCYDSGSASTVSMDKFNSVRTSLLRRPSCQRGRIQSLPSANVFN